MRSLRELVRLPRPRPSIGVSCAGDRRLASSTLNWRNTCKSAVLRQSQVEPIEPSVKLLPVSRDKRKKSWRRGASSCGRKESSPEVARQQSVCDLGIELFATASYQFRPHCSLIKRSAIRALGRHSIERVREHDHARSKRNILSVQTVRISAAVPIFMMMHDGRNEFTKARHRCNQIRAVSRMFFDNGPLLGRETRLFRKDRGILVVDFAYVVKE